MSSTIRGGFVVALIALLVLYSVPQVYLPLRERLHDLHEASDNTLNIHFAETSAGIEHIRAFRYQRRTTAALHRALHPYQKERYYILTTFSKLRLLSELCGGILSLWVIGLATHFPGSSSAMVGLSLFGAIIYPEPHTTTVWLLDIANQNLNGVMRIRKFCEGTPVEEDGIACGSSIDEWPVAGQLDFRAATTANK